MDQSLDYLTPNQKESLFIQKSKIVLNFTVLFFVGISLFFKKSKCTTGIHFIIRIRIVVKIVHPIQKTFLDR